jgi:hypothetical protein
MEKFLTETPAAELEAANRFLQRINAIRVGPVKSELQG